MADSSSSPDRVSTTKPFQNKLSVEVTENGSPKKVEVKNGGDESLSEMKKEANLLFLKGKRHFVIRDYEDAVESLAEALKLLTTVHGEQADELADVYFYYGKALFELARSESDVLGDQVAKDKNEDEEDDDEEEEEEDGVKEESKEKEPVSEEKKDDSVVKEKPDSVEKEKPEGNSEENGGEEKGKEEAEEEVNDLQLSWEYLELAKMIYLKQADSCKETATKLADVYLALGENGLESESYETAVDDMKECLKLQQATFPETDRRIAETYYQMGIAYSSQENFDEAIRCFYSAIQQLEKKLELLAKQKGNGTSDETEKEKDAFYTVEGEIEEIKSIVGEIKEKVSDTKDYKEQMKRKILEQMSADAVSSTSGASTSTANLSPADSTKPKPVSNISHLVRKKRKNEDEPDAEEKKPKTD